MNTIELPLDFFFAGPLYPQFAFGQMIGFLIKNIIVSLRIFVSYIWLLAKEHRTQNVCLLDYRRFVRQTSKRYVGWKEV